MKLNYIKNLLFILRFRGKGLAKKLIEKSEELALDRGFQVSFSIQ